MLKTKLKRKNLLRIKKQDGVSIENILIKDNWYDFACNCKIRSGQEIVYFIPYEYQRKLIEIVERNKRIVIAKTRQLGITETICNYFLWKALSLNGYLAVIFSKTQSDTSNVAKRLRRQIESLGVKTKTDSLTDIEFFNGGRILFRNSTPNGARGLESVSDLLFDESAFIDEIDEIYKAAIPCTTVVGDKAKIIILSTPNGQSGFYWEKLATDFEVDVLGICEDIKVELKPSFYSLEKDGIAKVFIHWKEHPKFSLNPNYLEDIEKQYGLSKDIVEQEYNLSFTSSNTLVFNPLLVYQAVEDKEKIQLLDGKVYFGLDTASIGSDYTVLTVVKYTKKEIGIIDFYRKNKQSSQVNILKISEYIDKYKPVKIGIETNGIGQIYLEQLSTIVNPTLFEPYRVTQENKSELITRLSLALEKNILKLPRNTPYIKELLSFKKDGKKLEAIAGSHDDCVMSLAFAIAVTPFRINHDSNLLNLSIFTD